MKKLLKRFLLLLICVAMVVGVMRWGPEIAGLVFGTARVEWLSEIFSETLREKNELVVYEVEIEAQETVTQEAWLIGTVQKVEIPYTFAVRYAVDLSKANIEVAENGLIVNLPAPVAKYQQLTVDEDNVRKQDWLYPLTAERYAEIKNELEQKLMERYANHPTYLDDAWNNAVSQIENLFTALTEQDFLTRNLEVQVKPIAVEAN